MMIDTSKARKINYYSLIWSEFAPDPANLRQDIDAHIEDQNLLELIKADGGVRVPVFATGKNKGTEDGKRLLLDGSSRRRCLEILSEDPEYLEAVERGEASLELPFIIVPDDLIEDPKALAKFKLSSNWVNSKTTTVEQWSGIQEIVNRFRSEYTVEPPVVTDPENLTDQDIQNQKNFLASQNSWVVQQTSKFLGFSKTLIYEYLRVFEEGSPRLLALIKDGTIKSVRTGDLLQRYHRRLLEEGSNMSIDQFINECYARALANGRPTLGRNTVEDTYKGLSLPVAEKLEQVNAVATDASLQTVQNGAKQLTLDTRSEAYLTRLQTEVKNLQPEDLEDGVTKLPTERPVQTNSGSSGSGATRSEQREPREPKEKEEREEEIYDRRMAIGDINDLIAMAMAVDDDQLWSLPEKNILRIGRTAKQLIAEFTALQEILGKERQKQMQQEEMLKLKERVASIENGSESDDSDSEEDSVEFDDDLEQSREALGLLTTLKDSSEFVEEDDTEFTDVDE